MFEILNTYGKRRLGCIKTLHGNIYTPAFGPDATRGVIKNIAPHEFQNLSGQNEVLLDPLQRRNADEMQFLLTNTYHIRTYPGDEFIKKMGGIHSFMNWKFPILTDSGGFQVFSLIHSAKELKGKVTDQGAFFNNPINGERLELTPSKAMDIQFNLGSDIMVVLDDCRPFNDHKEMEASVFRTIEWAKQCKKRYDENLIEYEFTQDRRPLLFAVVQGGNDLSLRKYCVDELEKIGFDGYGYGGYPSDDDGNFPYNTLEQLAEMLPVHKPRYAMGVGTPENMLKCIDFGYDLFDCVIPSRNGRHGLCYSTEGDVKIMNSKYKTDRSPLDSGLKSIASDYEKAYLHHLFKIKDTLGGELLSIHNLKYFNYLMRKPFLE
jgi:queuine tRNA-ribosyltransferase